ncbi:MAG: type II secretion system protein [Betaproteobacteria bacterium]|jgi:prepilin-type N-terminal cleavage/methylation domain-containing protein|nr:MAG: type II secretion system protein [Betaproteobacteria bacterium]
MTRNRGAGFTLIELVVTMSVIAILAALALSCCIALQTQARVAKTQAILGDPICLCVGACASAGEQCAEQWRDN